MATLDGEQGGEEAAPAALLLLLVGPPPPPLPPHPGPPVLAKGTSAQTRSADGCHGQAGVLLSRQKVFTR